MPTWPFWNPCSCLPTVIHSTCLYIAYHLSMCNLSVPSSCELQKSETSCVSARRWSWMEVSQQRGVSPERDTMPCSGSEASTRPTAPGAGGVQSELRPGGSVQVSKRSSAQETSHSVSGWYRSISVPYRFLAQVEAGIVSCSGSFFAHVGDFSLVRVGELDRTSYSYSDVFAFGALGVLNNTATSQGADGQKPSAHAILAMGIDCPVDTILSWHNHFGRWHIFQVAPVEA
jgi:hypothetical protein